MKTKEPRRQSLVLLSGLGLYPCQNETGKKVLVRATSREGMSTGRGGPSTEHTSLTWVRRGKPGKRGRSIPCSRLSRRKVRLIGSPGKREKRRTWPKRSKRVGLTLTPILFFKSAGKSLQGWGKGEAKGGN